MFILTTENIKTLKLYIKFYLFYNSESQLQIGHKVILLGENKYETLLARENHWNFFPGLKTPILLMPAVGFEPTISQSLSGGITPRLAHHQNHLTTKNLCNVLHKHTLLPCTLEY